MESPEKVLEHSMPTWNVPMVTSEETPPLKAHKVITVAKLTLRGDKITIE